MFFSSVVNPPTPQEGRERGAERGGGGGGVRRALSNLNGAPKSILSRTMDPSLSFSNQCTKGLIMTYQVNFYGEKCIMHGPF